MKFTLDDERVYEGEYTDNFRVRWNGFAMPRFTLEVATQILKDNGHVYHITHDGNLRWMEVFGDTEELDGCDRDKDGLYPLGAGAWIWMEHEED